MPSPIGPQPNTATFSPGFTSARLTLCSATESGSVSAATSKGRSSAIRSRLSPMRASRTSSSSVNAPSGPPLPMKLGVFMGLIATRSPAETPSTSAPTEITSPAAS
jgi:hypothetical protein